MDRSIHSGLDVGGPGAEASGTECRLHDDLLGRTGLALVHGALCHGVPFGLRWCVRGTDLHVSPPPVKRAKSGHRTIDKCR
jgi:hypothetical protein